MMLRRRGLLLTVPALPLAALATPARAETTDLILNCDPALAAPMAAAAQLFAKTHGVLVNIFPTPPGLILPQIARHIQNDMVITSSAAIGDAVAATTIAADAPRGGQWRNRLVIARRAGATQSVVTGRIAVPDATPGSDMDGPAILRKLNLGPRFIWGGVWGVIDTDEVVYLLLRGQVDAGLLHMTEIRANPGLEVIATVPDSAAPPILYSIAVTKLSRRPHPEAFIAFLMAPDGVAVMQTAGLEVVA
jgi:molybdate transport system substrate-binding protein